MLKEAGFVNEQMVAETGFNSSPKTKGALFRAAKAVGIVKVKRKAQADPLSKYQEFFDDSSSQLKTTAEESGPSDSELCTA